MGRNVFFDACPLRGFLTGGPGHLVGDGDIGPPAVHGSGEKVSLGLHPPPVHAQGLEQLLAEWDIAVMAAFSMVNMNDHALAVDVADLQPAQLGTADTRRVQGHQNRAVEQVAGRIDEFGHLLRAQDLRQFAVALGKGQAVHHKVAFQGLDVEEAQPGDVLLYGSGVEFAVLEEVGGILADLIGSELIGSRVVVLGEIPDDPEVRFRGILGVITTLEFLQHHLS